MFSQAILDRIIIMLTISRRAKHFSKGVFDVTSRQKVNKRNETPNKFRTRLKFITPVKIQTFCPLRKTYFVDIECTRCTQPKK